MSDDPTSSSQAVPAALPMRSFLSKFWKLTAPYWRSSDWKLAWTLSLVVLTLTLAGVGMSVVFNYWRRDFFNAIQEKNEPEFWHQLIKFCVLAFIAIVISVYATYLQQMLTIRWRRWLTESLMQKWLGNRAYYLLQLKGYGTDNPEQRIQQDIANFAGSTLDLILGIIQQIVTLASFTVILWSISGPLNFTLAGHAITIPGYMFWSAVLYAIAGTYFAYLIGRPLVRINFMQERYNANFRFGMTRLRENAESIAFFAGEQDEKRRLDLSFDQVWRNWFQLMKQTKLLNWYSSFYSQAAIVFPYIVAAPRYFSGAISFGVYTQIADAFGNVQGALSWVVNAFSSLAEWKASVNRLVIFIDAMEQAQADAINMARLTDHDRSDNKLAVSDLDIALPDGRSLLKEVDFTLEPGQHVLVSGPSGSGKTTLFRALAGLWPFGLGKVHLPKQANAMFLPQKPYLPISTLRETLCFPRGPDAFSLAALSDVLNSVNLGHLIGQLEETENWSMVLSGGEQQRLAIARAILAKPDWLFLDEATSALDEENEQQMYQLLTQSLPQSSIVSIAHRASLAKYHDLRLAIDSQRQKVMLTQLQPAS